MRSSIAQRILDVLPIVGIVGLALAGVFVAMTLLVSAVPSDASPVPPSAIAAGSPTNVPELTLPPAQPTATPTPGVTVVLPPNAPAIRKGVAQAKDPRGVWSAVLYYPQFAPSSTPLADAMNAEIASEVQDRLAQWQVGPAAVKSGSGKVNQLTGNFFVEMVSPTLASFSLTWVDNVSETAPTTNIETITYDLGTGSRMGLADVFADTGGALAIMSDRSRTFLATYLGSHYDPATVESGTSPSPSNFSNWSLTTAGFKVTFSEYQVAPYADGRPVVVVPWSAFEGVIAASGPVAKLAGH